AAMRSLGGDGFGERTFASSLQDFSKKDRGSVRFEKVGKSELARISEQRTEATRFRQVRQKIESAKPDKSRGKGEAVEMMEKFDRSPIRGRTSSELAKSNRPPERPEPN